MTPQWLLDQELDDAYERAYRHDPRWKRLRGTVSDIHGLGPHVTADEITDGVYALVDAGEKANGSGRAHLDGGRAAGAEEVEA